MNKGEHCFKWSSRMQVSMGDYFSHTIDHKNLAIFSMLWCSYHLSTLIKSAYFEIFRVGDGKHTLHVQKHADEVIIVKFIVNNNYANSLERFTK